MKKKSDTQTKDRMIHIRLDENTRRELKILAVKHDTTIQSVVEDLIKRRVSREQSVVASVEKQRDKR